MADKVQQILKAAELLRKGDVASGMKQILGATEGPALGGIKGLDLQIVSQALAQPQVAALPPPAAALQLRPAALSAAAPPAPAPALGQAAGGTTALALVGGVPAGAALAAPAAAGLTASPALSAGLQATAPGATAGAALQAGVLAVPSQGQAPLPLPGAPTVDKLPPGIDPERLRLAQAVGAMRLRMIQEAAQQQYLAAYTQQVMEVQQLHEKQQEAAQLALIMEAAEAQAEFAKQSLEEDKEEHHWHRRIGRNVAVCGHWQRGHCSRGDSCQFAHPEKEKGTLQTRGPAEIMRHNFKTVLCKFHANGNCPQGARCMFAHGPQDLRSPGMSLHKEEEEIVQRVAAARTGKGAPAAGAGQTAGAAATVVAPPGDLSARLAALQLSALAGLRGTALTGAAQPTQAGDQALQLDSAQLLALAQLSEPLRAAGVAVDASSLGLAQLAPAAVGLTTAAAPAAAGLQAATAAPLAVGLAPGGGLLQGTTGIQGLTASAAPGVLATAVPPPPPPAAVQPAPVLVQGLVASAPLIAAKAADSRPALLPGQPLAAQPLTLQTMAAQPLAAQQQFVAQPLAAQPLASQPLAAQPLVVQSSPVAQQPLAGQLLAVQQQLPAQPLAAQPLAAQPVMVGAPGMVATAVAPGLGAAAVGQPAPAAPQLGGLLPFGATTMATSVATSAAATAPGVGPALARPQLSASALELLARYAQQGGEPPTADQESKRLRLG